jgi:hypothetical protein
VNDSKKAVQLSDPSIHEMSLVFGNYKGGQWAPRHPEAVVLGTKAGEVKPPALDESRKSKSFLGGLFDKVTKAFNTKATGGDALQSAVQDAIEWALDGIQYDVLWSLTNQLQWDLYAIFGVDALTNDEKKDAASRVFAGFTAEMAKIMPALLGETDLMSLIDKCAQKAGVVVEKSGARHSAADKTHIDAIAGAKDKLGKAVEAAQKAHDAIAEHVTALQPTDSTESGDGDGSTDNGTKAAPVGPNGLPVKKADETDPKKPYGDVEYADPGLQSDGVYRYPIDTKEHAESAWSYINKDENAEPYSADDLASVKAKIKAACEKFGVEIDDSKAGLAEEIDMKPEEIKAMIAEASKAAATETAAAVKAELQPKIDEATQRAEKAEGDAAAAKAAQEAAEKASNAAALKTVGGASETPEDEVKKARIAKVKAGIKAALGANPVPTVI